MKRIATAVAAVALAGASSADAVEFTGSFLPSPTPATVPDGPSSDCALDLTGPPLNVSFNVAGLTAPITNLEIDSTISHSWVADLRVTLIAPGAAATSSVFGRTGVPGDLSVPCGDGSDLNGAYTFADGAPAAPTWWGAAAAVTDTQAVPPGSYRASASGPGTGSFDALTPDFAGLTTAQINGTWTLRFLDGSNGDIGTISAATLDITDSDVTAPPAPTLSSTDPPSPANNNSPKVIGTAEAGSTVRLYTTATCTGTPAAMGTPGPFGGGGLTVAVPDNETTEIRGTATDIQSNVSPCSTPIAYTEVTPDITPPPEPTLASTNPASPADDNSPEVIGTAEAGSTVRLYTTADCSGTPVATGAAATFGSTGLSVAVADNTTTQFRGTATDAASNASPCSEPISYVEATPAPSPDPTPDPIDPPDTIPPALSVAAKKSQKLAESIKVIVSCDEPCAILAKGKLSGGLGKAKMAAADLTTGVGTKLTLKLGDKALEAAAAALEAGDAVKLKVTVVATDGAGNQATGKAAAPLR